MKFTKEQFSEALKSKLTNGGKKNLAMSDRSFNEEVEDIYTELEESGNNDELELKDVVDKKIKRLERIDNNVRNDNSKFVREWEKNHPDKKDDKDDKDDKKDDKKDKDKIELLLEEIQNLKNEHEQEKKAKTISDKRNSLKSALKGKDVKNEEWINDQLELIHIDVETDVDALTEKLVNSYNKFSSHTPPDITPHSAGGGSGKTEDYADVVAIVKKQSHR